MVKEASYTSHLALWRICRTIANKRRLQLLWALFDHGDRCVSELAALVEISVPQTSIHLYALASHGLIQQHRRDMLLISSAKGNPDVDAANQLCQALHTCHKNAIPIQIIFKKATAFTHARRIEILACLQKKNASINELTAKTNIPESALFRHLNKLLSREFVEEEKGKYSCTTPHDTLSQTLSLLVKTEMASQRDS